MSRKYLLVLSGILAAAALSGCGKEKTQETELSTSAPAEAAEEDVSIEDLTEATEAPEKLEPITPSDYLIKDAGDYITLGKTEGLEVNQNTYEITDDMVAERIQSDLESYADESEVERPAANGDIVYADVTSTVHGEPDTKYTESTYLTLGDEEYSADFDSELVGASAGDTLTFTCSFDNDIWMDEWANKSVDFEVTVTSVCEMKVPEYTDEYVKENTDYSDKSEYEASVRELLANEYDETAYSDTIEALFQAAIDESRFSGYPEELYDSCKEEVLSIYGAFLGVSDEESICEAFDLSPDDIESDVLSTINRRLLISALCEENGLEVTEDDYVSFVNEYAELYGYESAVQFEEENNRTSLVWSLYENEAAAFLYDSAKITLTPYEEENFDEEEISPEEEISSEEEVFDEEEISPEEEVSAENTDAN